VLLESKLGSSLYLALYENALSTHVLSGENGGSTFTHERVVRKLIGPYLVDKDGRLSKDVRVGLNGIEVGSAGVVLFSQNANGRFEQALDYPLNSKHIN
jgi:hypothetical protein